MEKVNKKISNITPQILEKDKLKTLIEYPDFLESEDNFVLDFVGNNP